MYKIYLVSVIIHSSYLKLLYLLVRYFQRHVYNIYEKLKLVRPFKEILKKENLIFVYLYQNKIFR